MMDTYSTSSMNTYKLKCVIIRIAFIKISRINYINVMNAPLNKYKKIKKKNNNNNNNYDENFFCLFEMCKETKKKKLSTHSLRSFAHRSFRL